MKYRKRPPLSSRDIQLLILIGIVTVAVLGTLIGTDIQLGRGLPGGGGFYGPWEGARLFIFERVSPYSPEVPRQTQAILDSQPWKSAARPPLLTMPFFILLAYFPFAALADPAPQKGVLTILNAFSDPGTARGIWMFINEAALVGSAFLSLRLIDWQPARLFRIAFSLLSIFGFYSVTALLDGGPAVLLGLLYIAVLFAYARGDDELAGALLAFTLFAWEIGSLFVLLLLWKAIYDKRWRVLAGLGMTLFVLLVGSLIIYPGWPLAFVTSVLATLRSPVGTTSGEVFTRLSPVYGVRAAQAVTVLLVILLLYEWAATRRADPRRLVWAACLTLAATPLIGLRTDLNSLVVLFPSLALIFAATANRWRAGYWLAGLLLLIVFLLPWGWFVRWYWLQDQRSHDYLLLFLPLFTMAGLYWTRWWFIRPPRTWLEHVRTLQPAGRLPDSKRSLPLSGRP